MGNNLEIIYLDQKGYIDYLEGMAALEERLKNFNATRSTEAKMILLEEKYSTAEAKDLARQEKAILEELKDLRDKSRNIEIIERHGDETRADIGDRLLLEIMYSSDDIEEIEIELDATIGAKSINFDKVSINSPLGRAIFGKTIGGVYSYLVNKRRLSVHIKGKLSLEEKPNERK